MRTYNSELGRWEHGRNRFDILRLVMRLDDLQLALATHAQFYTDSGVAPSAQDRLPASFWRHVEELFRLSVQVSRVAGTMWEQAGLAEERDQRTLLYRDLLVALYGQDKADNILMDLASKESGR
jgi:hypothetical protein